MTSNGCRPRFPSEMVAWACVVSLRWLHPVHDRSFECTAGHLANHNVPSTVRQSAWDRPLIEKDKAEIDLAAVGFVDRARIAAISSPHPADWMMALPVAVCGLALNNEAVRVAVILRLGLALCASHKCQCGDWVGPEGYHGSMCRKASGRSLRHHAINDIIWRALLKADVPSTKEPAGLFRSDGKRPDGATIIPWIGGKYLTRDATVVHT